MLHFDRVNNNNNAAIEFFSLCFEAVVVYYKILFLSKVMLKN